MGALIKVILHLSSMEGRRVHGEVGPRRMGPHLMGRAGGVTESNIYIIVDKGFSWR